ncbi:MAG TPA: nucleotidyltransferase family protein [Gemmatimonadales bacterium]|nr:nucleotidyltransferase family protein [Gemmatimonadales bacterium]
MELPPEPVRLAGLVLAAGSSSRLGTNKLLLELGGEPLVRRAARRAVTAGLAPVIVVLGAEAQRVAEALEGLPVTLVENPRPADGMPASLRTAINAVPADSAAAVVILPDMPLVTTAMLAELRERFLTGRAPLVISLYGETAAPPTLYARSLFPALLAAAEGGREVVREHREGALAMRWPAELLVDVDVPADLERLRALAGDRHTME